MKYYESSCFFTNRTHSNILVAFLTSSVSTASYISTHSFFFYITEAARHILFVNCIPNFAADPYTPSAEEVQDPELFAENVRKVT